MTNKNSKSIQAKSELQKLYLKINRNGNLLDVGCFGYGQVGETLKMGRLDLKHFGVDYTNSNLDIPVGYTFKKADLNHDSIPFDDNSFDLIVCNHIIEHLAKPVEFFGDCARVCKPGGYMYFEAPSERSLFLPGFPFKHDSFFSLSLFDDPTHSYRPWTPQSFHKLARYWSCNPIKTGYQTSWKQRLAFPLIFPYAILTKNGTLLERSVWGALGWASYLIAQKPLNISNKPEFNYYIPQNR